MSQTICLCAKSLDYLQGGGHLWVYLNWALGLRDLGCEVIWMEMVDPSKPAQQMRTSLAVLRERLGRYGMGERLALSSMTGRPLAREVTEDSMDVTAVADADLLLNLAFDVPADVVKRFRRSALIDIDPGLTQIWLSTGNLDVAPHETYFTIGETVGQPETAIPDCGIEWHHTPPPIYLPAWPPTPPDPTRPFSTVTHWWGAMMEFGGRAYYNGKRDGFLPFLDLPRRAAPPLEIAICLAANQVDDKERGMLEERGWRVRDAHAVASTPWDYQRYVQNSSGEFSCAKPSCVDLQNAWISDRTLCYLASAKPAVVQHTGPSRFLPDRAGLLRFRDLEEAVHCLESALADYDRQCALARALAEEYFDARKVVARVLERALA